MSGCKKFSGTAENVLYDRNQDIDSLVLTKIIYGNKICISNYCLLDWFFNVSQHKVKLNCYCHFKNHRETDGLPS